MVDAPGLDHQVAEKPFQAVLGSDPQRRRVARDHQPRVDAEDPHRPRQGRGDIGEAAGLGEGQGLAGDVQDARFFGHGPPDGAADDRREHGNAIPPGPTPEAEVA